MNLVRVSEFPNRSPIRISVKTLYKWSSIGRFSSMFRKLGGMLLIDLDELERLIRTGEADRRKGR
jgi:hypothetical protein